MLRRTPGAQPGVPSVEAAEAIAAGNAISKASRRTSRISGLISTIRIHPSNGSMPRAKRRLGRDHDLWRAGARSGVGPEGARDVGKQWRKTLFR